MGRWERPRESNPAGRRQEHVDQDPARVTPIWERLRGWQPRWKEKSTEAPSPDESDSRDAGPKGAAPWSRINREPVNSDERRISPSALSTLRSRLAEGPQRKGQRPAAGEGWGSAGREPGNVSIKTNISRVEAGGDVTVKVIEGTFIIMMGESRVLYGMRALQSRPQPTPAKARLSPATLLGGDAGVTSFVGRVADLARLRQWYDSPGPVSMMLVHGAGGQGKTRLIRKFAEELRLRQEQPQVLEAVSLIDSPVQGQVGEGEEIDADRPASTGLLLLVDEADTWSTSKLEKLLRDMTTQPSGHVRILLTARASGTWWSGLCFEFSPSGIDSDELPLDPLDAAAIQKLTEAARRSLAKGQDLPQSPPLTLEILGQLAGNPLSAEMMVLASMHTEPGKAPTDLRSAVEALLGKEFRYWKRLYSLEDSDPNRIKLTPDLMKRAAYAAALSGPLPADLALEVVRHARISDSADPQQVIDDHARCYPPSYLDTDRLMPLPPCLIEQFLGTLVTDGGPETGLIKPDPWADSAPFHVLGLTPPWERKAEYKAEQRATAAGIEIPLAAPKYTAYTFREELLNPTILRLVRAASTWPHIAERQLYPLVRNYPEAVMMTTNTGLAELRAISPPDVLEALDRIRH
jgi:hypothetical protein